MTQSRGDQRDPARSRRGSRRKPAKQDTGRLVLRGARWPGDIAVSQGRIDSVGQVEHRPGDRELRCEGDVITPGLIDAHHHLFQRMTRGLATSSSLFGWLQELYPIWTRLDVADVEAAATAGLVELARSGCTTVADHHYLVPGGDDSVFDAIVEAARAVGVRLYLGRGSMDLGESRGGLPPDHLVEDIDSVLASTERLADAVHDGDMTNVVVAPCSPFTVTGILMQESAALARRRGLRLHTHLAETRDEQDYSLRRFGCRPLEYMERLNWLGPDVWYAHGIHLSAEEIKRVGAARAGVAHCPSSNGRLGSGICPVTDLEEAGSPVGLGADGAASNEVGTLFPELRQALYLGRLRGCSAEAFLPSDALRMATVGGARCLGRTDLGRLERGMRADIAVWPAGDLVDIADPAAALVLGPDRRVRHLFVGGRQVVADGAVTGVDAEAARRSLARRTRRLFA
jgi:cytosine/adenosine deaminase-related metal-dependent hydrolase